MPVLPEHVALNQAAWSRWAPNLVESGRRCWQTDVIAWGIWNVPEAELGALGDLALLRGLDAVELGCGTAYFSAWLAKCGARPVGVDITAAQLDTARAFQLEFGLEFPLIESSAEDVPLPSGSFDLALSEYGASIWCDPYRWIPEASRLLRPGGTLVFLRNSTISMLTAQEEGPSLDRLLRDWSSLGRMSWANDNTVEFQLPPGDMIRLLRANGFEVENLIDIFARPDSPRSSYEYITHEWAMRWPCEEIWRARKTR